MKADNAVNEVASPRLVKQIIEHVSSISIKTLKKLNTCYKTFSPQTYGETSLGYIDMIMNECRINTEDIIVDLGSGTGKIVLYVGTFKVKECIGIEESMMPEKRAQTMTKNFKSNMHWFGKKHSDFKLLHDNFSATKHIDTIEKASIIYTNKRHNKRPYLRKRHK